MVLKLALLVSHMDKYATVLIENLRKTSECDVMFDTYRCQTLAVAFFNLFCVFYIVFVKRIKLCIVARIIVEMGMPVYGVCIRSPKTRLVWAICETWSNRVQYRSQLPTASSAGDASRNGCSLLRRLWQDQLDMTWRVSGSQKIPFQPYSTNWVMLSLKQISSLM